MLFGSVVWSVYQRLQTPYDAQINDNVSHSARIAVSKLEKSIKIPNENKNPVKAIGFFPKHRFIYCILSSMAFGVWCDANRGRLCALARYLWVGSNNEPIGQFKRNMTSIKPRIAQNRKSNWKFKQDWERGWRCEGASTTEWYEEGWFTLAAFENHLRKFIEIISALYKFCTDRRIACLVKYINIYLVN